MPELNLLFHIDFVSVETIQILDISLPQILSSNDQGGLRIMAFAQERAQPFAEIGIRQFQPGGATSFRRLNEEWITRFFRIEPKEELILADPQGTILDPGGRIFFATAGDRCIGCCALIRRKDKEFEVAKMAVEPSYQGAGIGRRLLRAAIDEGRN